MDLLKGYNYGVIGGFVVEGWVPQIFSAIVAKLCVGLPKVLRVQNVQNEVLYHQPGLVGIGFHPPPGGQNVEFSGLSFTLLNVKCQMLCARFVAFAMKPLKYRSDFDTVGCGKICSCAPAFNILHTAPTGDNTEGQSPNGKIWGVSLPKQQNKHIKTKLGT